jgi:hypothetical protein
MERRFVVPGDALAQEEDGRGRTVTYPPPDTQPAQCNMRHGLSHSPQSTDAAGHTNASNKVLASCRSAVSKPSVNQP